MRKSDLVSFVHKSAGKALDFSMTGSRFPMETELVYSDSEDSDFLDEIPIDTKAHTTNKSAKPIETRVLTAQYPLDQTDL